jgi:hypothetical protein
MVSTVVITLFYLESEAQRISAQKAQLAAVAAERVAVEQREVATTEQARAEREAGLQRSIAEFLITDMLGAAAPNRLGANAKVSEVVNDAAKAVEGRFKDDVEEVATGYECGLNINNFNDIKVGDIIEGYEMVEIKRKL